MQIPMDWVWGFGGGLLIGVAAALLLVFNGRIMGASGIFGSLLDGSAGSVFLERLVFVAALILVPAVMAEVIGQADTHITSNLPLIVIAGLLVGAGTRVANGCTSGHGVCGISRFSRRGIAATLVYLAAGGVTMLFFRHGLGLM